MEIRVCPVCGHGKKELMRLDDTVICECTGCGHVFTGHVDITPEAIYTDDYFTEKHKNWFANPDRVLFAEIRDQIRDHCGDQARILDVGCGQGTFLAFLRDAGLTDLTGLDIIDVNVPKIRTIKSAIEDFETDETFDAVTSLANIEHIPDAKGYMDKMARLVRPGGVVVIYTVNEKSLIYRLARMLYGIGIPFAAKRLYEPHHVNHFSVESLAALAKTSQLETAFVRLRNIPTRAIDIDPSPMGAVVRTAIVSIQSAAELVGMQTLQMAVFTKSKS
ncbi:methyltransferase domain-containing protein [Desulfovibrio inopinatus]|uniref:methyltransferase domain-containing protein n=1 Tax=Desulfovibrio inopinatus TaxID=102109 RepID=UPI00047FDBF0|nr:methyltransferase domain-containing protein [Desulfovibrio inopinatus]